MVNKKILIISNNSFSFSNNNGKTLNSLFDYKNEESISQLYFSNEIPESNNCKNYFRISDRDLFKKLLSFGIIDKSNTLYLSNQETNFINNKRFFSHFLKENKNKLQLIREILWLLNLWKSNKLKDWLIKTKPEHVFFVAGDSIFTYKILIWVLKICKCSYSIYITDDYYNRKVFKNYIQKIHYYYVRLNLKHAIKNATNCFSIGTMMSDEYEKLFQRDFIPIMNCIDKSRNSYPIRYSNKNNIVLRYFGGFQQKRWESLVELGKIIKSVECETGLNIELEIYTPCKPSEKIINLLSKKPLKYIGILPSESVEKMQAESDYLVHVDSFDNEARDIMKYSVSTKLTEYMFSKTCIIGYGPYEIANMKLLSENKLGIIITDNHSFIEKKDILKRVFLDQKIKDSFINSAYAFVISNFDKSIMRSKIESYI